MSLYWKNRNGESDYKTELPDGRKAVITKYGPYYRIALGKDFGSMKTIPGDFAFWTEAARYVDSLTWAEPSLTRETEEES